MFGPSTDEPLVWYEGAGTSDRRYLHADERGSVIAVTNDAGAAIAINRYDEFGIPGSGNIGRFQYTGQKWIPELGMYDYKARMYSPTLGRFLQTDPIGYGDGLNWYNYVGGDPVNMVDPSGLGEVCARSGAVSQPTPITIQLLHLDQSSATERPMAVTAVVAVAAMAGLVLTSSCVRRKSNRRGKYLRAPRSFLASKGLGGPNLGSVTFHNGDGGSLIAKAAFAHGNPAITIQNNVYVAPGHWNSFREGTAGFFEETVHSMQWAESGAENFVFAWAVGSIAGAAFTGDPHNSPLEAQAMGMSVDLAKAYSGQCRK